MNDDRAALVCSVHFRSPPPVSLDDLRRGVSEAVVHAGGNGHGFRVDGVQEGEAARGVAAVMGRFEHRALQCGRPAAGRGLRSFLDVAGQQHAEFTVGQAQDHGHLVGMAFRGTGQE